MASPCPGLARGCVEKVVLGSVPRWPSPGPAGCHSPQNADSSPCKDASPAHVLPPQTFPPKRERSQRGDPWVPVQRTLVYLDSGSPLQHGGKGGHVTSPNKDSGAFRFTCEHLLACGAEDVSHWPGARRGRAPCIVVTAFRYVPRQLGKWGSSQPGGPVSQSWPAGAQRPEGVLVWLGRPAALLGTSVWVTVGAARKRTWWR